MAGQKTHKRLVHRHATRPSARTGIRLTRHQSRADGPSIWEMSAYLMRLKMGWLSKLLGRSEKSPPREVQQVFEKMRRLLNDDAAQIAMIGEPLSSMINQGLDCDQLPDSKGRFGLEVTNPIPVNGPIGELAYLSKLRTSNGERLLFHRIGSQGTVDVFEAVDFSGQEWFVLYLDMYHPRKSRLTPAGLSLSDTTSQFTGFTNKCADFPRGFSAEKAKNSGSGLNFLYASLRTIEEALSRSSFDRPSAHIEALGKSNFNISHKL